MSAMTEREPVSEERYIYYYKEHRMSTMREREPEPEERQKAPF